MFEAGFYPWYLGSVSLFFCLRICCSFSWHADVIELFCTAGTDMCKSKLLKTWYLSCLQLCILTILGYGKHELCKIFHLAQKIPMTASNVIEFQVISFALALKWFQLLLLITFFFLVKKTLSAIALLACFLYEHCLLPNTSLVGGHTTP